MQITLNIQSVMLYIPRTGYEVIFLQTDDKDIGLEIKVPSEQGEATLKKLGLKDYEIVNAKKSKNEFKFGEN